MLVPILALLAAAFAGAFLWAFMGWQRTQGALAAAEVIQHIGARPQADLVGLAKARKLI